MMTMNDWPEESWNPWNFGGGHFWRWIEKDSGTEFGQVWYNKISDIVFIRRTTHEFDHKTAQVMDKRSMPNCEFIGFL